MLPQGRTVEPNPEGHAEADVRDTTVTLPAGVQLNPSAANGLEACPERQHEGAVYEGVGFEGFQKFLGPEREPAAEVGVFTPKFRFVEEEERLPSCPAASKIGVVHIKTPLLPKELEGAVYLAEPAPNGESGKNPFDSLVALYIVAEDHEAGVLVKLAGEGHLDQSTGQLSTSFRGTPQLPFEELRVELFGGQRASLSTPAVCGTYSTLAEFTPWSSPLGSSPVDRTSAGEEFDITENCSASTPLGFSPSFDAQSTSTQAGAFTGFSLQLPKALSTRLTTLQKACTEAAFNTNPASCDPESVIGHATIQTPVLKNPLSGPAYLVSHGGAAFPDVEFVLQGEEVEIVLDGKTDIKEGITYSKFESAPDAPFTVFETELPSGPDSILTANVPETEDYSLCKASLVMPTRIVAQDGATIEPSTKITAQGCGEVKSSKVKKLTLTQKLKQALAQCRKHYKHSKARRVKCERSAHARYTSLALAACRKQDKHSKKQRSSCESLARRRYGAHAASRTAGKTARRHG